jgi:hypothetical protein
MDQQDFPLIIANMPATGQQRAMAAGIAAFLIVTAAFIAPFASIQLGQINGFIQVLQTALSLAELITAALLFSQFSIQPQAALLALACGYMFSASFAFLQTLAFPGGYAAEALIGDGPNSSAWIYVLWHLTFPAAILVYALSKDAPGTARPGRPATRAIAIAVACTLAAIALLTWIVTESAISAELLRRRRQIPDPPRQSDQPRASAMVLHGARGAAVSPAHHPRFMADGDFARLYAKLPGGADRQLGTIYRRLVCGARLRSGRQLHVADRVAHRDDAALFAPCQRHGVAAARTHQPAAQRGSRHRRHRP